MTSQIRLCSPVSNLLSKSVFFVAFAGTLTGAGPALAQARAAAPDEGLSLSKLSLEELTEIEVNVPAKMPQLVREAPSVGSVVTRPDLQGYGWLSLNDVLARQPGFVPAQDYERRTTAARGLYEGWNNNHLLLLVDGVPINNISNGTAYTWEVLPLFMVERAEIFRGPGSALYGTSATNGVIALNTRSPGPGTTVEATARLGNAATQIYDVFAGQSFSLLKLSLGYNHFRTDGNVYDSLDNSGRVSPTGAPQTFATRDQRSSHFGYLKLEGSGALQGLSLQAHLQQWSFETGHGWLYVVPDEKERAINQELRAWLDYKAPPLLNDRLHVELVTMVQRHVKEYRIKYLPDGFKYGYTYPEGVMEDVRTGPSGFFGRAQVQLRLIEDAHLLAGVEDQLTSWGDDERHSANVDLNQGSATPLAPNPDNRELPLRNVLEPINGHPINNVGVYLQASTGRVLRRLVDATVGARYDLSSFDYVDITDPARPVNHISSDQLSPRLGLVVFPHDAFTVKGMVERAFRAPNPSELATANSLLAVANVNIKPEEITTATVAVDALPFPFLNLRADWFYQRFENQIAFSAQQNKVANIYSRSLTGFEAEALFEIPAFERIQLSGFGNFTGTWLLDETVDEPTITASSRLTWAPKFVGNAGLQIGWERLHTSVQGHYQGRVRRRASDRFDLDTGAPTASSVFRPASVAPWFTLDARISFRVTDWLRAGVQGSNLLGSKGALIKTQDFPFDFQIEGPRVLATLELATRVLP